MHYTEQLVTINESKRIRFHWKKTEVLLLASHLTKANILISMLCLASSPTHLGSTNAE